MNTSCCRQQIQLPAPQDKLQNPTLYLRVSFDTRLHGFSRIPEVERRQRQDEYLQFVCHKQTTNIRDRYFTKTLTGQKQSMIHSSASRYTYSARQQRRGHTNIPGMCQSTEVNSSACANTSICLRLRSGVARFVRNIVLLVETKS